MHDKCVLQIEYLINNKGKEIFGKKLLMVQYRYGVQWGHLHEC
jgi:hypothetical protein